MVTESRWVVAVCWMSFTGRALKNKLWKQKGREKDDENGRLAKGEMYCVVRDSSGGTAAKNA